jgi:hypothetical protein
VADRPPGYKPSSRRSKVRRRIELGDAPVSIAEGTGQQVAAEASDDALAFDRELAFDLMRRGLDRLSSEYAAGGKGALFEALKPWLGGSVAR